MLSDANVCDPAFADGTLFGLLDFSFYCEARWYVLMETMSQCAPLFLVSFSWYNSLCCIVGGQTNSFSYLTGSYFLSALRGFNSSF